MSKKINKGEKENLYSVLGIDSEAEDKTIKTAYKTISLSFYNFIDANFKEIPSCLTAYNTISLSFLMS